MNKKVIVVAFVVAGSGIVNSWINKKPLTPVIMGAYIFVLMLAVMDAFGGELSTLAGAFSMLIMTYVLLVEFPWSTILKFVQGQPAQTATNAQKVTQQGQTFTPKAP